MTTIDAHGTPGYVPPDPDACIEERIAIAMVDGELTLDEAWQVVIDTYGHLSRDVAPDTWGRLNRRWRATVNDVLGADLMDRAHAQLKEKCDVESFADLTLGEIWASIQRLEEAADG